MSVVRVRRWGFPLYNLYQVLIKRVAPDKLYASFCSSGRKHSTLQKAFSHGLYLFFFLNDLSNSGDQLIVLAAKSGAATQEHAYLPAPGARWIDDL
jgi:hypothetical protein